MKLPPYPRYKPSGVEWLGDVPEHWKVSRLGYAATKIGSGKTPRGGADVYQSDGVMLIRSQNVYETGLRLEDAVFVDGAIDEEMAGTRVRPHDVLLNITGASLGRCAITSDALPRANVNQHVCIIRPEASHADPGFLQRSISSAAVQSQIFRYENGSSREGLNFQQVHTLILAVPPLQEQQAIAAFLDRETGRVDRLVAKKRELIERLKEKRTALISRTVTRGLPAEAAAKAGLPVNPPLKPSGIRWLGEIPMHWRLMCFRRLISRLDQGWSPNANNYPAAPDELGVLKLGAASKGKFYPDDNKALDEIPQGMTPITPARGDLLISRANTPDLVGEACVVKGDYPNRIIPDLLYRLRLRADTDSDFVCWFILSRSGRAQIEFDARGSSGSMVKVGQSHVRAWMIPFPLLPEQAAIAAYLDEETAKLDAQVGKVEEAAERLQEYRTALITAAVTGKSDVRPHSKE